MTPTTELSTIRRIAAASLLSVTLLGCANDPSPGYFLEWVHPEDNAGQQCVAACGSDKWQCGARNAEKADLCQAEQEAKLDECAYQDELAFESCLVDLQTRFPHNWEDAAVSCDTGPSQCAVPSCGDGMDCDTEYESCFLDCGGDLIERGTALENFK